MRQAEAAKVGMEEYRQRLEGWEKARQERWELERWSAWHAYNLSPFLKHKPKKPADVITFPWEKKETKKATRKKAKITQQEVDALNAIMKDFYERKYSS